MTPSAFKAICLRAGLTQSQLAAFLRISDRRAVRYWETGERAISGPVSLLMELLDAGTIQSSRSD
jgi:DNA-binding transcriptional regulator YiaG